MLKMEESCSYGFVTKNCLQDKNKEINHKKEEPELLKSTLKKQNHQTNKHKSCSETDQKHSSNIHSEKCLSTLEENSPKKLRNTHAFSSNSPPTVFSKSSSDRNKKKNLIVNEYLGKETNFGNKNMKQKVEFCGIHDIELLAQKNCDTTTKELFDNINRLPNEIDKTNAFLTKGLYIGAEAGNPPQKTLKVTNVKKHHITPDNRRNKKINRRKQIELEKSTNTTSEIYVKRNKSTLTSYIQNFICKAHYESSLSQIKLKKKSASPNSNNQKIFSPCTDNKIKHILDNKIKEDSKCNIRVDYIQWLYNKNKFFNMLDSINNASDIKTNESKNCSKCATKIANETAGRSDSVLTKKEKRKKHHVRKLNKKPKKPCIEQKLETLVPSPKPSKKNNDDKLNKIALNKDIPRNEMHHVKWLTSVEHISDLIQKPLKASESNIRKTSSLDALGTYVALKHGDKEESFLQPNHDLDASELKNESEFKKYENYLPESEKYQSELYNTTNQNECVQTCEGSFINNSNTDYDLATELKESTDSVESLSIAIKKRKNNRPISGSFNIEITHCNDDPPLDLQYNNDEGEKYGKEINMINYNYNKPSKSSFNFRDYHFETNEYIPKSTNQFNRTMSVDQSFFNYSGNGNKELNRCLYNNHEMLQPASNFEKNNLDYYQNNYSSDFINVTDNGYSQNEFVNTAENEVSNYCSSIISNNNYKNENINIINSPRSDLISLDDKPNFNNCIKIRRQKSEIILKDNSFNEKDKINALHDPLVIRNNFFERSGDSWIQPYHCGMQCNTYETDRIQPISLNQLTDWPTSNNEFVRQINSPIKNNNFKVNISDLTKTKEFSEEKGKRNFHSYINNYNRSSIGNLKKQNFFTYGNNATCDKVSNNDNNNNTNKLSNSNYEHCNFNTFEEQNNMFFLHDRGNYVMVDNDKNNTAIQCDLQSSISFASINTPAITGNRKRKYDGDYNSGYNDGADFEETEQNNFSYDANDHITVKSKNSHSILYKTEQKQSEILFIMTELRQNVNTIQDQISVMNINCNKYENIETLLVKLEKDISVGLKNLDIKLKEIEDEQKCNQLNSIKGGGDDKNLQPGTEISPVLTNASNDTKRTEMNINDNEYLSIDKPEHEISDEKILTKTSVSDFRSSSFEENLTIICKQINDSNLIKPEQDKNENDISLTSLASGDNTNIRENITTDKEKLAKNKEVVTRNVDSEISILMNEINYFCGTIKNVVLPVFDEIGMQCNIIEENTRSEIKEIHDLILSDLKIPEEKERFDEIGVQCNFIEEQNVSLIKESQEFPTLNIKSLGEKESFDDSKFPNNFNEENNVEKINDLFNKENLKLQEEREKLDETGDRSNLSIDDKFSEIKETKDFKSKCLKNSNENEGNLIETSCIFYNSLQPISDTADQNSMKTKEAHKKIIFSNKIKKLKKTRKEKMCTLV